MYRKDRLDFHNFALQSRDSFILRCFHLHSFQLIYSGNTVDDSDADDDDDHDDALVVVMRKSYYNSTTFQTRRPHSVPVRMSSCSHYPTLQYFIKSTFAIQNTLFVEKAVVCQLEHIRSMAFGCLGSCCVCGAHIRSWRICSLCETGVVEIMGDGFVGWIDDLHVGRSRTSGCVIIQATGLTCAVARS